MAVVKQPIESRLLIAVQTGTNEFGQPVLRTRSFSRVKPEALDQDLYDVALTIGGLQQHAVAHVNRVDDGELIDQPV